MDRDVDIQKDSTYHMNYWRIIDKYMNWLIDQQLQIVKKKTSCDYSRIINRRVRQWVEEYAKARGVKNYVAGQVLHTVHESRARTLQC